MSGRVPRAAGCLARFLQSRDLEVPDRLRRELEAACRAPFTGQLDLYERLMLGCEVLDSEPPELVPQAWWDRFEAILNAWVFCVVEIETRAAIGRRRRRVAHGGWEPRKEPRITGLDRRNKR